MDFNKLRELLKATIDPNRRKEAEEELNRVSLFDLILGRIPVIFQDFKFSYLFEIVLGMFTIFIVSFIMLSYCLLN